MKKHISLSITERCNLNCVYCFEKSKSRESMQYDTAIRVLTNELNNSPDFDEISCDFMGGEPFLEFDLIKKICEYFWTNTPQKKISFYTTTNGTLVHGEIKEWLKCHSDKFACMLSLDGNSESHNHNRTNSFDRIDIPFFISMWSDMKVKAITSKETLIHLYENIVFLHNLGFKKIEMKLAYGFNWNDGTINRILLEQLNMLKEFYLSNPELLPCSLLNVDFCEVNYLGKPIKKWCNAGVKTVSYDMKGNKYPCRYFQDLTKGKHITPKEIWETDFTQIQNKLTGKCMRCIARDLCRTCYAYNFEINGDYGKKEPVSCITTRTTLAVAAQLILERKKAGDNIASDICEKAEKIHEASLNDKWFIT